MVVARRFVMLGVAGAALAASPAAAQLGLGGQAGGGVSVGGNVGVGANVGVAPGAALDRTVDRLDPTATDVLDSDLRLATTADLESGAIVRNQKGNSIGVLQSVSGDAAVVVKNGQALRVPLATLYRGSAGLVTKLSKAELKATAGAGASVGN